MIYTTIGVAAGQRNSLHATREIEVFRKNNFYTISLVGNELIRVYGLVNKRNGRSHWQKIRPGPLWQALSLRIPQEN